MGQGKPRPRDRATTPPPGAVPDDPPCTCGGHDGEAILCFAGCGSAAG